MPSIQFVFIHFCTSVVVDYRTGECTGNVKERKRTSIGQLPENFGCKFQVNRLRKYRAMCSIVILDPNVNLKNNFIKVIQ